MRIIQLLPELNEGGVERGVVELNREFVKQGVESLVISKGGRLEERIGQDGGQHIRFDVCSKNPVTVPLRVLRLRRLVKRIQPDILHARSRVPAWLTFLANKNLNIPFVTTVHGMNSVSRYSKIMVSGDRVICVSEVIKRYIQRHYSVDEKKVRVIQRGVDMNLFDPDNTDQEFIRDFKKKYFLENRFIVTSVGRVTYLKDYETFIRAISICRESIPNIVGIIVGSVREDKISYLESLESLVRELGIESNVIFTGGQSRMPEIYQLSDVVVNVSLKMGNVGRTVVEALAMNTPVLATTFEGLENLVVDYRNGFLVTNQDPNGLCERILQLYTSPITETRSSIRTEYTLDAMVEDTLAIYRSLLDERADIRAVA